MKVFKNKINPNKKTEKNKIIVSLFLTTICPEKELVYNSLLTG